MELQPINQVTKSYGVSTRMLYYYEQIGLISSLRKADYAYRVYDETALRRLQQIIVLRKLRIPMKHISVILNNSQTAETMDIFMQNIRELDDEIKTLSTIRDVLARLVNELDHGSNIRMNFDLLTDSSVLSIIETLSLSKNLIKETTTMADFKEAEVRIIPFGKYQWRVLDEKDGKVLIITENIIEERDYHNELVDITWEHCEMRQYLNDSFYKTFTPDEQSRILEKQISDRDNPWSGTKCGNPTVDKVFLLSYDEVIQYFGDSGDLLNRQGWTWTEMEGFPGGVAVKSRTDLINDQFINDQYCYARRAYKTDRSIGWWWLRSPGGVGQHTSGSIGKIGEIFLCGDDVFMHPYRDIHGDGGVRPVMWVKLE